MQKETAPPGGGDAKDKNAIAEPSTSTGLMSTNDSAPAPSAASTVEKDDNGEEGANKGPYTRAARRIKTTKNGEMEPELVELKEPVKKRATAMANVSDQRGIQIGRMFQAPAVPLLDKALVENDEDRDTPVWITDSDKYDEAKLDQYIDEAVGVYRLSLDRALYILLNAKYNIEKAREEVKARKVVAEEWSDDDQILFRIAFQQYGKNFHKIRQMMPYRSLASIIQFYYHVKKRWKSQTNVQNLEGVDMMVTIGNNEAPRNLRHVDVDGRIDKASFFNALVPLPSVEELVKNNEKGTCENCGNESRHIRPVELREIVYLTGSREKELRMCLLCRQYYEKCGVLRPTNILATLKGRSDSRYERLDNDWIKMLDQFVEMHTVAEPESQSSSTAGVVTATQKNLTCLDLKLRAIQQQIMEKKAVCSRMESQLEKEYSQLREFDDLKQRAKEFKIRDRPGRKREEWTDQEKYIAIHSMWRYEMNWEPISEMVPTKSKAQLLKFYEQHKKFIDDNAAAMKKKRDDEMKDMPVLLPATHEEPQI